MYHVTTICSAAYWKAFGFSYFYVLGIENPNITIRSGDVIEGENVTLICNYRKDLISILGIRWDLNQTEIATYNNSTRHELKEIQRNSSGYYKCVVLNTYENKTSDPIHIDVKCKSDNIYCMVHRNQIWWRHYKTKPTRRRVSFRDSNFQIIFQWWKASQITMTKFSFWNIDPPSLLQYGIACYMHDCLIH